MHRRTFLTTAATLGSAAPIIGWPGLALAIAPYRVTGPFAHENLALYFAHGPSAPGPVPLTLQEALAKRTVLVHETGDVNRLVIENRGEEEVFVQAGEIVKGGKQDRVLTISMLLPKNSGPVPIGAYCVEQGRWERRGAEDASKFSSSEKAMPSRKAKLAMKVPSSPDSSGPLRADTGRRQSQVWRDVADTQMKLAGNVGSPVASPQSRSSLQLSLENKKVAERVAAYVAALKPLIEKASDSLGFAFAVNGALNSADVYPSHGLFTKLWPKLLDAAVTEAIAEKNGKTQTPPTSAEVAAFIANAEKGRAGERTIDSRTRLATRESDKAYYFETRRADGEVLHRNYIAR
jgi:hypothetical protein